MQSVITNAPVLSQTTLCHIPVLTKDCAFFLSSHTFNDLPDYLVHGYTVTAEYIMTYFHLVKHANFDFFVSALLILTETHLQYCIRLGLQNTPYCVTARWLCSGNK